MNFIRLMGDQLTFKVNKHVAIEPESFCLTSAFSRGHYIIYGNRLTLSSPLKKKCLCKTQALFYVPPKVGLFINLYVHVPTCGFQPHTQLDLLILL